MGEAFEKYMKDYAERYAKKCEKVATMNNTVQIAKTLMETLNLTAEQVMAAMRIPEQERAAVMERL